MYLRGFHLSFHWSFCNRSPVCKAKLRLCVFRSDEPVLIPLTPPLPPATAASFFWRAIEEQDLG